jgi:tRNA-modifying protein YgfZ
MHGTWSQVRHERLGVLRASGADVMSFLQGQLSNDVRLLGADRALLAGYHNPQGRVIALLRLVLLAREEVLAILPRELIAPVLSRLGKFILRAKVKLADESPAWNITGILAPAAGAAAPPPLDERLPDAAGGLVQRADSFAMCVEAAARWLLIAPAGAASGVPGCEAAPAVLWQRAAIAAGEPQVYGNTSEEFVAQMLNLDVLGAIAFDKGCYTGQEVIARAHYRGRVKRRLQRFVSRGALTLQAGAAGTLGDGRAFKVVEAAPLPDGRCEFLAVAPLPDSAAEGAEVPPGAGTIEAEPLALPYPLPP